MSKRRNFMRRYETIYIIRPNLGEDDMTAIIDRTNGVIEETDGHIVQLDKWGLKKLAYLIKKETQGYYVYCEYAGTPAAVAEIERLFRIDDKVLKYLTVKLQDTFIAEEVTEDEESTEEEESSVEESIKEDDTPVEASSNEDTPPVEVSSDEDKSESEDKTEKSAE
jgi:small subunit ribosomal protein S6